MSRRTIISVAASVIIGVGCIATTSTDAFAYRGGRAGGYHGGVHHGGVYRGGVYRGAAVRRGVAVGVGAAAVGAAAYGAYGAYGGYRCGYYPYRPCYETGIDETGIDGTGIMLVDSSFERAERGVVSWQHGGKPLRWG